ncbi:MAG: DNA-3-methyladenine glycosylase 2 family protein [Galactobacter sp.]|uniref:DNA-3-methyladenine glycosylase 2 family protein n=1 Tax=Galactobacter sp. TaxID=2676125 RepID=UPI0025C23C04|nr:Ada metal-binding domain-containing protein [Galactobacter sp.]
MSTTRVVEQDGPPPFDVAYAAIHTRDTRFDGRFYTTVLSTGIYCRPSCPSRTPKPSNVAFVKTAAKAQAAGFRPCLRCFPEALPGPASSPDMATLAGRALAAIEAGALDTGSVGDLSRRLGTSTRTLNRTLISDTGVGAVQHARTRRARTAFRLLTSTDLEISQIAFAAGFGSIRTFNETIQQVFGRPPGRLRVAAQSSSLATDRVPARLNLALQARGPIDVDSLLEFYAPRTLAGVDAVQDSLYVTAVRLRHGTGELAFGANDSPDTLRVSLALDDAADLNEAISLARRMADLDADSPGIDAALSSLPWLRDDVPEHPGIRLPGEPTLTESLLRAIVTQQVSVASGRAQLRRLVATVHGAPDAPAEPGAPEAPGELTRLPDVGHSGSLRPFPTAAQALQRLPEWFRGPATRQETLRQILELLSADEPHAPVDDAAAREATLDEASRIKGIGPWTLAYARLRTLGDPDVDLSGDAALLSVARSRGLAADRADLMHLMEAARPWRSYAALHLWRTHSHPTADQNGRRP